MDEPIGPQLPSLEDVAGKFDLTRGRSLEEHRAALWGDDPAEKNDLREALEEYGQHNDGCSARHGDEYRCRCGWRETAARLGVREGPAK